MTECPVESGAEVVFQTGEKKSMARKRESRHLSEEQTDSEKRFHILFEQAPDAYYLNDLKGNFIDGNKAAEEITGYSKNELIGKSFLKLNLLPKNQIPKAAKLLALNALGKPTGPDEFVLNRKDGVQIPVEIRTIPTKFKDKTLILGIARDITRRKKAERLALESQQKFEGLFRGNPEATVYTDSDMRVLDVNPRFTNLFGYRLNEIKDKYLDDIVVPGNLKEEGEMLGKKALKGYIYFDTVRAKKDGSLIPVSISAAPIFMDRQLSGYIGVYKDISKLKKTENGLKQAMRKQEIMNEKLRVVGGLTRHDVRNKLAAITGNVYLIEKESMRNEKILGYLGEIKDAVQQSVRIYDFAKAYEMLGVEELSYMDVENVVDEAVSLFSDLGEANFVNNCHGLTVLADSLLRQLFYNLIDNSRKHGQKVAHIRIYYETTENGQVKLVYEDDGTGIRDDAKTKIFNEGYTTGKGSGYGLYLIKKMTEVYGWAIHERGEPGKGVKFVIEIPEHNSNGNRNYQIACD